jgi:hypothetical protein
MKSKRWRRFLLCLVLGMLLSGCATSALWEEGRFARIYDPARPTNLRAFHSQKKDDVLVVYDELRDDNDSRHRRAYWLRENGGPVENPHRPHFVSTKAARDLPELLVFQTSETNAPPDGGFYLVTAPNHQDFALYSGPQNLGDYQLPVYADPSGRVLQVLLTPVAVVADVTVVGGLIFIYAWASSGPCGYAFNP